MGRSVFTLAVLVLLVVTLYLSHAYEYSLHHYHGRHRYYGRRPSGRVPGRWTYERDTRVKRSLEKQDDIVKKAGPDAVEEKTEEKDPDIGYFKDFILERKDVNSFLGRVKRSVNNPWVVYQDGSRPNRQRYGRHRNNRSRYPWRHPSGGNRYDDDEPYRYGSRNSNRGRHGSGPYDDNEAEENYQNRG